MTLTKDEVLERLCKLSTKVMMERFSCFCAADCFCGKNPIIDNDNYRFDEKIMLFIEKSVENRLF